MNIGLGLFVKSLKDQKPAGTNLLRIICIASLAVSCQMAMAQDKSEPWIQDLDYLVATLNEHHPNLYHRTSEKDFESAYQVARKEISAANSDAERYFALRRLVAQVKDGHTQLLENGGAQLLDLRFPLRADAFEDGIFLTYLPAKYEKYLGSRIDAVDAVPIKEVYARVEAITNVDNQYGRERPALMGLIFGRFLHALKITDDPATIELSVTLRTGEQAKLKLNALKDTSPLTWATKLHVGPKDGDMVYMGSRGEPKTPLHLRYQADETRIYWHELIKDQHTLYVQLNAMIDQRGKETFQQYTRRFWKFADDNRAEFDRLVIDLRYNDGGVARRAIPFINEIIKRDRINKRGNLMVLMGTRTYSAAVIFITELAVHTKAVFVGEPPASPFDFFSDARIVGRLPNSGYRVLSASRQVDNSWSSHGAHFPPDLPVRMKSHDYFSGKDLVLERAITVTVDELDALRVPDGPRWN